MQGRSLVVEELRKSGAGVEWEVGAKQDMLWLGFSPHFHIRLLPSAEFWDCVTSR
jgi:hypothetical protein